MLYMKIEKVSTEHTYITAVFPAVSLKLISVEILVITASRIISNQFDITLSVKKKSVESLVG